MFHLILRYYDLNVCYACPVMNKSESLLSSWGSLWWVNAGSWVKPVKRCGMNNEIQYLKLSLS